MSDRLFQAAQKLEADQLARNILSVYSKVDRESDQIRNRAQMKNPPPIQHKEISSQDVIQMIRKPLRPSSVVASKLKQPRGQQKNSQLKSRISNLKTQIQNEEKSLNSTRKMAQTSKEETEFTLFRLKLLCQKATKTQIQMERKLKKDGFNKVKEDWERVRQMEAKLVMKRYKRLLRKYFDEMHKQTIILKLERQKHRQKMEIERAERNDKVAVDFRQFILCRRSLKGWRIFHEKERVERHKVVVEERLKQENQNGLRSKLHNFLSNLKEEISLEEAPTEKKSPVSGVGQINTIEEVFEESQESGGVDWALEQRREEQEDTSRGNASVNQPQSIEPPQMPKKMTNDELMKKRQQLEAKNKQRKDNLEQLRKEKEDLRMKAELEKKQQEERQREEEKRRRQDEHERFVRKRREEDNRRRKEEEDRKRLDDLYILAEAHSLRRIMKFAGMLPWKKMITQRNENMEKVADAVDKVKLSMSWRGFLEGYSFRNDKMLEGQNSRMQKVTQVCNNRMLKKVISAIKYYNQTAGKEQKEFLKQFRDSHICREAFGTWKNNLPELKEENYKVEADYNKVVERFRRTHLTTMALNSLRRNRETEQKERRVLEHKAKLEEIMDKIAMPKPQLNLDNLF